MSKATIHLTQEQLERAERRRTKRIADFRDIGIHIEEDTPLEEIPAINKVTRLKMLATKHRRPISHLDLSDRAIVDRELDRLMMLEGGTRRRGSYRTIKVKPTPVTLSAAERRRRANDASTARDGRSAARRFSESGFSESFGYGSHASYNLQVADANSMGAETLIREATDAQRDYIQSLSAQKRIPVQIPTRFDLAQELIDELVTAEPAPTPKQAQFLSDLQQKLGLPQKPAATAEEARTELGRLIAIRNARRS